MANTIRYSRPLTQFAAAGAVTIAAGGQTVSIEFDANYRHEWSELDRRLTAGHRVRTTPANGNCGLWAVYWGFRSLAVANGWPVPTIQEARNFLHPGLPNSAYWHSVFDSHCFQPTFLQTDYMHDTWFSSSQLDLLTEWLARSYANQTRIRNVYVCQEPGFSSTHRLVLGQLEQTVNEQLIFIYYTRNDLALANHHYQAIGPANFPNQLTAPVQPLATGAVTGHGSYRPPYRDLPDDDDLLYITGRLHENPRTGSAGQIQTPVRNKDLQARFGVKDNSTIAKRVEKARAAPHFTTPVQPATYRPQDNIIHVSRDLTFRWPDMIRRGVFFETIVRPVLAPAALAPAPLAPAPAAPAPVVPAPAVPAPAAPLPALRPPGPPALLRVQSQPRPQPQIDPQLLDGSSILHTTNGPPHFLPASSQQPQTVPGYGRIRAPSLSPPLPGEPEQAIQREYPSPPLRRTPLMVTSEEQSNSPPHPIPAGPRRRRGWIQNAGGTWESVRQDQRRRSRRLAALRRRG